MNKFLLLIFLNSFVHGDSQVQELELFEMKKTLNESCIYVTYSFKTCAGSTFIYEIGEQFEITFQRKLCPSSNVFMLNFDSKELGHIKSKITINQNLDTEINIILRFKLDEILSILYKCYYKVNNQIYLQIHIIKASMEGNVLNQTGFSYKYSERIVADHKTVMNKNNEYKEIDSDGIDEFFADCFYESRNYFYGILACFGIGILYLIVLYLSRRFISGHN